MDPGLPSLGSAAPRKEIITCEVLTFLKMVHVYKGQIQ